MPHVTSWFHRYASVLYAYWGRLWKYKFYDNCGMYIRKHPRNLWNQSRPQSVFYDGFSFYLTPLKPWLFHLHFIDKLPMNPRSFNGNEILWGSGNFSKFHSKSSFFITVIVVQRSNWLRFEKMKQETSIFVVVLNKHFGDWSIVVGWCI